MMSLFSFCSLCLCCCLPGYLFLFKLTEHQTVSLCCVHAQHALQKNSCEDRKARKAQNLPNTAAIITPPWFIILSSTFKKNICLPRETPEGWRWRCGSWPVRQAETERSKSHLDWRLPSPLSHFRTEQISPMPIPPKSPTIL